MIQEKVTFDPGYSKLVVGFPNDLDEIIDGISQLKQNHQKKFQFTQLENTFVQIVKNNAAFYLGCVLWGSYLHYRYKEFPAEIFNNPVLDMPDEEQEKLDYTKDIDYILGFIEKFEKSCKYFLNRPSRIKPDLITYFEIYKQFVELNNNFKGLKTTDQIKLPEAVSHFANLTGEDLEELKNNINDIISSEKIERLLDIGFYRKKS